ncbi:MAG: ABC transporter permease [Patulibacter minatonensis]
MSRARTHRLADLRLGMQLAWSGARTRTLLAAVGIGLATAVLLLAASLPPAAKERSARLEARGVYSQGAAKKGEGSMVVGSLATEWHGRDIGGFALQPDGAAPPLPPGVQRLPAPGELVVSPALAKLLAEPGTEGLRTRLGGRVVGEIAPNGVSGARDLYVYAGSRSLPEPGIADYNGAFIGRVRAFGDPPGGDPLSDAALFLAVVGTIVLLIPVGVLVSTAARFGGERRDRRLAALRLIGGSARRVTWIAAGESLAGAALGLVVGGVVFLLGRQAAEWVSFFGWTVYPSDVRPDLLLLLLVVVGVPLTAVATTLVAMRRVVVEPLSVSRRARSARGRLWWRVLLVAIGIGLLVPPMLHPSNAATLSALHLGGAVGALFLGTAFLLPWLVEVVARRLPAWSVPSQLALRSLRAEPAGAARIAAGLALAVAGAITLQTLLTQEDDTRPGPTRGGHYTAVDLTGDRDSASALAADIRGIDGVQRASIVRQYQLVAHGQRDGITPQLSIGTCADLIAVLPSLRCEAGSVVPLALTPRERAATSDGTAVHDAVSYEEQFRAPAAGERVKYRAGYTDPWTKATVPASAADQPGLSVADDGLPPAPGLLAATGALPEPEGPGLVRALVWMEPGAGDAALEALRDVAARRDQLARVYTPWQLQNESQLADVRRAIVLGAAVLLALLSVSLVVISFEQVSAQRRTLATLSATGVPARTLRAALWLRALVPTAIGLALATVIGLVLGWALLRIQDLPLGIDPVGLLEVLLVGGVLSMLATACVLPVLRRASAPAEMRTE